MKFGKFAALAAATSLSMLPLAANALPPVGMYTGTVSVSKNITLNCTMTAKVEADSVTGDPKVVDVFLSGGLLGLCGTIGFSDLPYSVTEPAPGYLDIFTVDVSTITFGGCRGTLSAEYVIPPTGGAEITFINATVPPEIPGTGDCKINGRIFWVAP